MTTLSPESRLSIGLIGDHDPAVLAHRAIPEALRLAGAAARVEIAWEWLHTAELGASDTAARLERYDALWLVPASPYASTDAALAAARFARERSRPFIGTCGGFQHALLEYARNVWGLASATHAELDPAAPDPLIAPLACSLVEEQGEVHFPPGSRLAMLYGDARAIEGYHCRYGLNPAYLGRLAEGPLRPAAWDSDGDIRAVELWGHPFYVLTLFQPERAALKGQVPPLARALVEAAVRERQAGLPAGPDPPFCSNRSNQG